MKLWEIKAQALRLMFADTDIQFSEEDFSSGKIRSNANTREYLVRMDDTINRALDLFYQFNGEITQLTELAFELDHYEDDDGNIVVPAEGEEEDYTAIYKTVLDTTGIENFGQPSRVDIVTDSENGVRGVVMISYDFDYLSKEILFPDDDYSYYADVMKFRVYYKMKRLYLPEEEINEMEFDLDTIHIPSDVQRVIPKFIKGELFEEDEYGVAQAAKQEYLSYLQLNQRNTPRKSKRKVRNRYPRTSS